MFQSREIYATRIEGTDVAAFCPVADYEAVVAVCRSESLLSVIVTHGPHTCAFFDFSAEYMVECSA